MFEPIRGGTRGGQGEFKWSDVSADKDRENYLGHSTNAPTGRWQKNKDIHWYSRDLQSTSEERAEEMRKIKEAEAEALSVALCVTHISYFFSSNIQSPLISFSGFGPSSKKEGSSSTPGTGTNAIPVPARTVEDADVNPDAAVKAAEKAERKRRRAERREEKATRRAEKLARKEQHRPRDDDSSSRSPSRRYTRSPSPPRRRDGSRGRAARFQRSPRSRSPPHRREFERRSELPPRRRSPDDRYYDGPERNPERARDRERWSRNARR
ncbi:kinase phosphorylation protein-domain-containing protein [Lactarius quietus]|nr:kinase phosphorylation protein-domain-containing protein [Lactarius quietus]